MPPSVSHFHDSLNPSFQRVIITPTEKEINEEIVDIASQLLEILQLRKKYVCDLPDKNKGEDASNNSGTALFTPFPSIENIPKNEGEWTFECRDGVFHCFKNEKDKEQWKTLVEIPDLNTYYRDLTNLMRIITHGPCKTFSYSRLRLLESRYNLHIVLNEADELATTKLVPHRDFYNVRKVDTHIHHSSSMNQKHLLTFIKRKLTSSPNEIVIERNGKYLTLREVFESLKLTPYDLSVDALDVHADRNTFHRFDRFNLKYNPIGQSRLREIFLKQDNFIKGRYLAELTHELFDDLKRSKYQCAEYRLSIYGRKITEWDTLANWIVDHKLFCENVRFLIQIPRLFTDFKQNNLIDNMGTLIDNIFKPLFEVTINPSSHPKLHMFLQFVVGFDCVDDESKPDKKFTHKFPPPKQWGDGHNPPYSYYMYYLYANIKSLNHLRAAKGYSVFSFRPHSGEAGEIDHLGSSFLLANGINHGINLKKAPVLQYLFYLTQIGLALSPLSNNSLFLEYQRNPFPIFHARGLNVSLSTDDPLQFHYTKEPLIEEYSIAAQVYKLSTVDLCEIARNSVIQSGFEPNLKRHWLGNNYDLPGPAGNDIEKTNVPNIRICFRFETRMEEINFLINCLKQNKTPLDISILQDMVPPSYKPPSVNS